MKKLHSIFFISIYLLFALTAPSSFAKKKSSKITEAELNEQTPIYQNLDDHLAEQGLVKLSSLKGNIESADIKAAQRLLKALVKINQKQYSAASSLLLDVPNNSVLSEYIDYYLAYSLLYQKQYQEALNLLPPIKNPVKKIELEKSWLRINILAITKNKTQLTSEISNLKKLRNKDKWVDIKGAYYLGLAEFLTGNKAAAQTNFTKVLINNPGTEFDSKIFKLLKTWGISKNNYLSEAQWNLRADNLIENGFPHEAQEIWEFLHQSNSSYQERVAYGTFKARDYTKSARLYEELLKSGNSTVDEVEILSKIAQSYARFDNFDKAISTYTQIINKYPQSSAAAQANFKLGFLYFDSQQYKKAFTYLEKFISKGTSLQREQARWFRLWSLYLTKDYSSALAEIESLAKEKGFKKNESVMLDYWKARLADKLGQKQKAKDLYQKIADLDGVDYYGLLSRQRLEHKSLENQTLVDPKILSMIPSGNGKSDANLPRLNGLSSDKNLVRAILLNQIGLDNYAYNESTRCNSISTASDYNTAKTIEMAGNYNAGYASRQRSLTGASALQGFRLAFPQAYDKYVTPYSSAWNIDENLAYSVMRQESTFKPEIMSYAYAYGLMQVIPPTGSEIAQKIAYPNFHASMLNDPQVNTLFGTYYLSYLLKEFNNEPVFAMAGYNAGPDAVKRWIVKAPHMEMDEFIELIPYKQTNDYVKKVLVNYLIYKKLYQ